MSALPYIPETAPFNADQRAWLNGFLVGLLSNAHHPTGPATSEPPKADTTPASLCIMYGSQSGTAEGIARQLVKTARHQGFAPSLFELNDYSKADLSATERLLIVTSTWGDGDPPDNATEFWSYLQSDAAPSLSHLQYSVLALGDSSYSEFCGAGIKFDQRLQALGAQRLHPRADCDVDDEDTARTWETAIWPALKEVADTSTPQSQSESESVSVSPSQSTTPTYNRKTPYLSRLLTNLPLNGTGSAKDTRHFEFELEGPGLDYEVGDAFAVFPQNCPDLIQELILALGHSPETPVSLASGEELPLGEALLKKLTITNPPKKLLKAIADNTSDGTLRELLTPENKKPLAEFLWGREIIDLLKHYSQFRPEPAEFAALLSPLQPRLYSIASSPKAHPGQVHLTVAIVRYQSHQRSRKGVCSTFLAERVLTDARVATFFQRSPGFRLPADTDRPVIMVGPGTGIAPFRAFLEERREVGAKGNNWLFFGDQHAETDFLYQKELVAMRRDGHLTHLHTAFSRDQQEKIYVQHQMLEHAKELWTWVEQGAHFYVCGDASRMAKDVDAALHQVIETAGCQSKEQAQATVKKLKSEKRYQRDVY